MRGDRQCSAKAEFSCDWGGSELRCLPKIRAGWLGYYNVCEAQMSLPFISDNGIYPKEISRHEFSSSTNKPLPGVSRVSEGSGRGLLGEPGQDPNVSLPLTCLP